MRGCILSVAISAAIAVTGVCRAAENLYVKSREVALRSAADRALAAVWQEQKLMPVFEASDNLLVRRLYLDLAGRLPSVAEAKSFVYSPDKDKYEKLVDKLLGSPDFVAVYGMRFGDMLRIKSEFPINLWPNAVYVYQRRVENFIESNEPYHKFVRSLLLAQGSNFRVAEANFYRAHADRSPLGIAKNCALTLCGVRLEKLPEKEQKLWANIFEEIGFKSTREWKEEIVFIKRCPAREIILPDGKAVKVPAGKEARRILADFLTGDPKGKKMLADALVNRTWYWFFGSGIVPAGDDLAGAKAVNPKLLDVLSKEVVAGNFDFRKLCRTIVCSAAYRSASFQGKDTARKAVFFAAYPIRRLEAEILDDIITDLSTVPSSYASVIPEPFTFIPGSMRTIQIADGSISSSFLILFGRPSRDAGTLAERNNTINAKQRLFLFNSGALYRRVCRILRRRAYQRLSFAGKVDVLYWMFYSRSPNAAERAVIEKRYNALPSKQRWAMQNDIAWILVNSAEFLHRH